MGVGGQRQAPTALPPQKRFRTHCNEDRVAHRAGPDGCGKSNQLEFDQRTVQPIVNHYTYFTNPAHIVSLNKDSQFLSGEAAQNTERQE
jgi:hypothetical protein